MAVVESLGQRIRRLRKERRMTQQVLADGLVTASMISQIEADRAAPSPKLMEGLAERLRVDVSVLAEDVSARADQSQAFRRAHTLMELEQFEEAAGILTSLLTPVAPQFREQSIYQDLADCYEHLHRYDEAVEVLNKVAEVSFVKDDVESAVHAYFRAGKIERGRSRLRIAKTYFRRAAETLERHGDVWMPLAPKIHVAIGRICLALDLHEEGITAYRRALDLADQMRVNAEAAAIYHGLASLLRGVGQYDEALTMIHSAIRAYQDLNQTRLANYCRANLAVILRNLKEWDDALSVLATLLKTGDVRRDHALLSSCLLERMLTLQEAGRREEALEVAREAVSQPLSPTHRIAVLTILADAADADQALEAAAMHLDDAIAEATSHGLSQLLVELRTRRALLYSTTGQSAAAADAAARASEQMQTLLAEPNPLRTVVSV